MYIGLGNYAGWELLRWTLHSSCSQGAENLRGERNKQDYNIVVDATR